MPVEDIPPDIVRFIRENFSSVVQLEIFLFLQQNQRSDLTADDVGKNFYIGIDDAKEQLSTLVRSGFLQEDPTSGKYHFFADPKTAQSIAQVSEIYAQRRTSVIPLIYSNPQRNIKAFSDAFRLRQRRK